MFFFLYVDLRIEIMADVWVSPKPPSFDSVKDQCEWYIRRFIKYCLWCSKKAGLSNVPDYEVLEARLGLLGTDFMIGELFDLFREYGKGFEENSILTISKVAAKYSTGDTVDDVTSQMKLFSTFMEKDETSAKRLFSYLRQLSLIINGGTAGTTC